MNHPTLGLSSFWPSMGEFITSKKIGMTRHKVQNLRILRDEMKAVARGERVPPADAAKASFNSVSAVLRLLTPMNRKLLAIIRDRKPQSVADLERDEVSSSRGRPARMSKPYSLDLRVRLVRAVEEEGRSDRHVCRSPSKPNLHLGQLVYAVIIQSETAGTSSKIGSGCYFHFR
jgi:hypothetical protein